MADQPPSADATHGTPAAHRAPPPRIPGYADVRLHRRGSSAEVYRATSEQLDRTVAVKLLRLDELTTYQQFRQEIQTAMRLSAHPRVVPILDTGMVDGRPYLAMEFCEDGSYAEIVDSRGPLSVRDAVDVGISIAEALRAAHETGFIHRDVTPGNILRSGHGPALADFGIARRPAELSGTVTLNKLTPHHAAPEALLRQPQSASSDIYSLGSSLWQLLAGHPPFAQHGERNPDPFTYRERALHRAAPLVPRPEVPVWLQTEIARALAKRPEDRHPDAAALAAALRRGWHNWKGEPWQPPTDYPPLPPGTPTGSPPDSGSRSAGSLGQAPADWAVPSTHGTPEWPEPTSAVPTSAHPAALHPTSAGPAAPHPPSGSAEPASWMPATSGPPSVAPVPPAFPPAVPAYPETPETPRTADRPRRRVPAIPFLVAGAAGVLLGVLVIAALRLPGGDATPRPTTVPETTAAGVAADKAPTGVRIGDRGSSVVLSWTDRTGGAAPHYVVGGAEGASPRAMTQAEKGIAEVTIEALNPAIDYCFTVIAVISVDEVAPSARVCTTRD